MIDLLRSIKSCKYGRLRDHSEETSKGRSIENSKFCNICAKLSVLCLIILILLQTFSIFIPRLPNPIISVKKYLTSNHKKPHSGNESMPIDQICEPDYIHNNGTIICHPRCSKGYFILRNMKECHPWLTCSDIREHLILGPKVGGGNIKKLYLAKWKDYEVVVSRGHAPFLKSYFNKGVKALKALQPNLHVTQFVGVCRNFLITEYHSLGDLKNLEGVLANTLPHLNTLETRFALCIDYATILALLSDPTKMGNGVHIMCDSSNLHKLLTQYLLSNSLRLILNDIDSLPFINYTANERFSRCGKKPKTGSFAAPEQRWPQDVSFKTKGKTVLWYDEKVDIWKVPDVCNAIIGNRYPSFKKYLHKKIHKQCKDLDPKKRPTGSEIAAVYKQILLNKPSFFSSSKSNYDS